MQRETDRRRERERVRQCDRLTDKGRQRQTDRHTERRTDKRRQTEGDRQIHRGKETETEQGSQPASQTDGNRLEETDRHRGKVDRQINANRQTDRQTEIKT